MKTRLLLAHISLGAVRFLQWMPDTMLDCSLEARAIITLVIEIGSADDVLDF